MSLSYKEEHISQGKWNNANTEPKPFGKSVAKKECKNKIPEDPWRAVKKASVEAVQSVKRGIPVSKCKHGYESTAITIGVEVGFPKSHPSAVSVGKETITPSATQVLQKQTPTKPLVAVNNKLNNATAASLIQTLPKARPRFSLLVSNFVEQLSAIAVEFREEIKLYQQHLITLHSFTNPDPFLIVVKIFISNNESIATGTLDIIQNTIISWIGEYQHLGMDTPIFHNISINGTDIALVCENLYAYECLQKSIGEIGKLQLIPHLVSIVKMPPVSHLLHCYGAICQDIIADPQLFLTQTKLHKPALEADHWIVVSHEVCAKKQETHFILLLEEQSSLILKYCFDNKLFICMRQVQFKSMP